MTCYIHTEADLDSAIAGLIKTDSRWRQALAAAGRPALRRRPDGFAGLASIVVSQQVSTASAKAIWGRLETALDPFSHETVRRARTAKLARAGLSAPKIRTLKAIARAIDRGDLDLAALSPDHVARPDRVQGWRKCQSTPTLPCRSLVSQSFQVRGDAQSPL